MVVWTFTVILLAVECHRISQYEVNICLGSGLVSPGNEQLTIWVKSLRTVTSRRIVQQLVQA